jgi:hypothetical protein
MEEHNRVVKYCCDPCGKRAAKKAYRERQAVRGSRAA